MSASTRTVQITLGIRHLAAALVAIAVAIVLAAVLAFGQPTASGNPTGPGAHPAPPIHQGGGPDRLRLPK